MVERIEIRFTGLRPGEKIKEELIIKDAEERSCYESIYVIRAHEDKKGDIPLLLQQLRDPTRWRSEGEAYQWLSRLVPEFRPDREKAGLQRARVEIEAERFAQEAALMADRAG